LAERIEDVLQNPARTFPPISTSGRKIYQAANGFTVVVDPDGLDGGTAFVPSGKPIKYFQTYVRNYES